MLILPRKENQEIVIGDDVVLKVLKVRGTKVVLGIEAPEGMKIWRGEKKPDPPDDAPIV